MLNLARIDQLRNWAELRREYGEGPSFVYLHLVLPHPPLFLDESCDPRPEAGLDGRYMTIGEYTEPQLQARRAAYVEQVQCANRVIGEFLGQVDEDTVIVITSDHGPDSLLPIVRSGSTPEQQWERLSTFTAIRLPEHCEPVPDDQQLVNIFRVVLGCLSDSAADPLDKRYYIASYAGPVEELKDPDLHAESDLTYKKEPTS